MSFESVRTVVAVALMWRTYVPNFVLRYGNGLDKDVRNLLYDSMYMCSLYEKSGVRQECSSTNGTVTENLKNWYREGGLHSAANQNWASQGSCHLHKKEVIRLHMSQEKTRPFNTACLSSEFPRGRNRCHKFMFRVVAQGS